MKLLVLLLTATFSIASVAQVKAPSSGINFDQIVKDRLIKNEVYFKNTGNKLYVAFPYNYLSDGNPMKADSLKFVDSMYLRLLKSWASAYSEAMGIEDAERRKLIEDESVESYELLRKNIQNKPFSELMPSELFERKRSPRKSSLSAEKDLLIDDLQGLADINKLEATLSKNLLQFRKEYEELYDGRIEEQDPLFSFESWSEFYRDITNLDNYADGAINTLKAFAFPDYRLFQVAFNFNTKVGTFLEGMADKVAWPKLRATLKRLTKFSPSSVRFTIITRPWVVRVYDFRTAKIEEYNTSEASLYIWVSKRALNVNGDLKPGNFFRFGTGGINGVYPNLGEIEGLITSLSLDLLRVGEAKFGSLNRNLNLKLGYITPLINGIPFLERNSQGFSEDNPLASYYLISGQVGSFWEAPKPGASLDVSYSMNFPSVGDRLGLDFSGLEENVLDMIGSRQSRFVGRPPQGSPGSPSFRGNEVPRIGSDNPTRPSFGNNPDRQNPVIGFPREIGISSKGEAYKALTEGIDNAYSYQVEETKKQLDSDEANNPKPESKD